MEFTLIVAEHLFFLSFVAKNERSLPKRVTKRFAHSAREQEYGRTAAISPVRYII